MMTQFLKKIKMAFEKRILNYIQLEINMDYIVSVSYANDLVDWIVLDIEVNPMTYFEISFY